MAVLAKTVAAAVTATGPGAAVDLTVMARSLTMQTTLGGVADQQAQVELEVSLDGVNFWGIGYTTGAGQLNNDQDVCQYVRANVLKLASGNVTAVVGYVSG